MHRTLFLLVLPILLLTNCSGMETSSKNSANAGTISDIANKTVIPNVGKISIIQDSFLFFAPNPKQAYFVYPQANLSLLKTHFYVQVNVGDIVTCGIVGQKSAKKQLIIKAELTKTYKGDVSGIASICSGRDARIYFLNGKTEITINTKPFIEYTKFKTPRLIFPFIPYFGFTLKDVAAPSTDEIKLTAKIEFFDRLSKSTISNCTYYTIDGVENTTCYGVPVIYPETVFYGKIYKSQQLHPMRSVVEYLDKSSSSDS